MDIDHHCIEYGMRNEIKIHENKKEMIWGKLLNTENDLKEGTARRL